jgi:hypothetical protein
LKRLDHQWVIPRRLELASSRQAAIEGGLRRGDHSQLNERLAKGGGLEASSWRRAAAIFSNASLMFRLTPLSISKIAPSFFVADRSGRCRATTHTSTDVEVGLRIGLPVR